MKLHFHLCAVCFMLASLCYTRIVIVYVRGEQLICLWGNFEMVAFSGGPHLHGNRSKSVVIVASLVSSSFNANIYCEMLEEISG